MVKWFARIAGLLVALALVLALLAWWALRGSLPQLDGHAAFAGLSAPADVSRDALGVVTVDAANGLDAVRALGYVHAQERAFEMDLMRRSPAGELAALFGPAALDVDRRHRVHRMRARARAEVAAAPEAERRLLLAYADGVNAGMSALRTRPWPYLLLRATPEPWMPEDSVLVGHAMYFDLQDAGNARELALWKARPHLPDALYALVAHAGSDWDAPLVGRAIGDAVLPGADVVDLRTLPTPDGEPQAGAPPAEPPAVGSNNFAVAGTLTAHGSALVADDMHLGLRAPGIWFRARLRHPDPRAPGGQVDVSGFTLPGLPAVIVGSNGHVAWGFTNSYGDYLDWALETPCDGPASDTCTPLARHRERIDVAGGEPEDLEVEESSWGPVLHRLADGRVLTLRWTAHLPGAINLGLAGMARVPDIERALLLARDIALPNQNLVIGDSAGRIAWRLLGPVPLRAAGCDPTAPIEPAASDCPPWTMGTRHGPTVASPTADRIWTANARVVDGAALATIGDGGYALGARGAQIRDALRARERFDERDLLAIQLDDRALFLERWHALMLERARGGDLPALRALADASDDWSGHASIESTGYRLVRAWRVEVNARIAEGLLAPARAALGEDFEMPPLAQLEGVAWPLVSQRPGHLLPRRHASWDALFEEAAAAVRDDLAGQGPLGERSWGEANTARICHPLAQVLPGALRGALCMPADPLPGDAHMPRVQAPAMGASQRMIVAPGREAEGIIHQPGGQSGHPLSPFWGAGHADWVQGRPSPFLPGDTLHTLALGN
ncbi:penicillin acylase family protein [Luteimonas sp. MC1750]|uniref:penicillin acylase family protein n=1 Tax=Luteimonas sp. MC1750 TaxID=2799326 RepID=UPI0018F1073C|nr:penicillin acylase family protein [Luteimonas sp. MC1750]MBJ6984780.1 penicillin acylase family protein [Luteimonas sp. MC1750]QQO07119.1 penicillin acylase family protein [Luteimonas sp. MC1750]